jgi:cyclophilin family peptidyl-prolyl cis-trans isomerase
MKKLLLALLFYAALLCRCQSLIARSVSQRGSVPLQVQSDRSINNLSRRNWFQKSVALVSAVATSTQLPQLAVAVPDVAAEVTDKVFVEIKGLPTGNTDGSAPTTKRIVIGLFGKEAPQSVDKLKKLMSQEGLPAPCKPKEERILQREQLEANKVYNSCIEGRDKGVNYDYAQIWRVIQGERLDFGSVAGRFISRESPTWEESVQSSLRHDRGGLISVRKGGDSGFGFTVHPGGKGAIADLDDDHIIVGQVLEGLDTIEAINNIPVITSAKVNYMGLTGGPNTKSAPSRACRYGGPMYCNENKPLTKLTICRTGVL